MGKKLLLIGGGGHCHSVLDSVLVMVKYTEVGIIDNIDGSCLGIPVIGTDDDIPYLFHCGWTDAVITVGSVGKTDVRRRLYHMVKEIGLSIPTIIDPSAIIARGTEIGEGIFIGKKAVVNAGAVIKEGSIINTGAIVEHDCVVGSFSHISPGTVLCGYVQIGRDSHIGAGAVVKQQISIGKNALIGAGSVVVKDIPDNAKAFGNPCRVVENVGGENSMHTI